MVNDMLGGENLAKPLGRVGLVASVPLYSLLIGHHSSPQFAYPLARRTLDVGIAPKSTALSAGAKKPGLTGRIAKDG